jgi:hypothetical protein
MAMAGAAPPDLSTEEGRAAYKEELRAVAFWPRQIGLGLVIAAALALMYVRFGNGGPNPRLEGASLAVMAVGWLLLVVAFVWRNRYHRRRVSGG